MSHKILCFSWLENRRLLWLTGATIAVLFLVQYTELPYQNIFSSLFAASKIPVVGENGLQEGNSSFNSGMESNMMPLRDLNSTVISPVHDHSDEGNITKLHDDVLVDQYVDSNSSSRGQVNMRDNSSTGKYIERSTNVTDDINDDSFTDFAPEGQRQSKRVHSEANYDTNSTLSEEFSTKEDDKTSSETIQSSDSTPPLELQDNSSFNMSPPTKTHINTGNQVESDESFSSSAEKSNEKSESKQSHKTSEPAVISISEMNELLLQNRVSHHSMMPRWSSEADRELLYARSQIENAPIVDNDPSLYSPLYRNVSMFKRSYELMEEMLKIYIYKEGERPIFHQPGSVLKGIYASEGWFMKQLETSKKFVTKNPRKAHLFYLPFSSRNLEERLYVPGSHNHKNLIKYLKNYVDMIAAKYPFWNRTEGADHFLVACHDWAPSETRRNMANCIRALCNSDVKEGFVFGKDVSLPETYVRLTKNPLRDLGGKPPSKRKILAFFAGNMHGYLRQILLQQWENKDPDMKIFGPMPKVKGKMNYIQHMKSSKYCICAKGYEVNSPRVVEAIFYECIPVIISDNFVPPFFEVLNWESFAVFVLEKDIPNLKNILLSIPEKRYRSMQMRVKKVQQHFLWHARPVKYDIFHMILHSVWYNRIFQMPR